MRLFLTAEPLTPSGKFRYALEALPDVLATKWDDGTFKTYCDSFPESATVSREAFEAHVKDLTERDVKVAYLKDLQGKPSACRPPKHQTIPPICTDVLRADADAK